MRPSVIVLDVNGTLSDLSPLGSRFAEVGAPGALARVWFASILRDGFALAATGDAAPFETLAEQSLQQILAPLVRTGELAKAIGHVLEGLATLEVHPDVPDGVRALRAAGLRVVTLTNGGTTNAEGLLRRAGIRQELEHVLSVEDAGIWKPAAAAYAYAARTCGVEAADMLLCAVHPWDIDGAAKAGLATAYLNRRAVPYPGAFRRPDHEIDDLRALAGRLTA